MKQNRSSTGNPVGEVAQILSTALIRYIAKNSSNKLSSGMKVDPK